MEEKTVLVIQTTAVTFFSMLLLYGLYTTAVAAL